MSILQKIAAKTKERISALKQEIPLDQLKEEAACSRHVPLDFYAPFRGAKALNVIAEVKRASPSKGAIALALKPREVANAYVAGGAKALSVLTEPDFFKGSTTFLKEIRADHPTVPLLMKDFFIDEYQLYQARALGADAILLIMALLGKERALALYTLAAELSLNALIEVHQKEELALALTLNAPMIGINNRDLNTLTTSLATTRELLPLVPPGKIIITESGIHTRQDLLDLHQLGCHGFLIGTSLMTGQNPGAALAALLAAGP